VVRKYAESGDGLQIRDGENVILSFIIDAIPGFAVSRTPAAQGEVCSFLGDMSTS